MNKYIRRWLTALVCIVVAHPSISQPDKDKAIAFIAPSHRHAVTVMQSRQVLKPYSDETLQENRAFFMSADTSLKSGAERVVIPGLYGQPNINGVVVNREKGAGRPLLLHFHGGGFIAGNADMSVESLIQIARELKCTILTVDYRLAPEHPFPAAVDDGYSALKWAQSNSNYLGINKSKIVVFGESAGGGLASMVAIRARDQGDTTLAGQVLIYPMLDDRTGSSQLLPDWLGSVVWNQSDNRYAWSAFLGQPAGAEQVPYGAVPSRIDDLTSLPPTFIAVGSADLFVSENILFADKLLRAGVQTELLVIPGGYHVFELVLPESREAQRFTQARNNAITELFTNLN